MTIFSVRKPNFSLGVTFSAYVVSSLLSTRLLAAPALPSTAPASTASDSSSEESATPAQETATNSTPGPAIQPSAQPASIVPAPVSPSSAPQNYPAQPGMTGDDSDDHSENAAIPPKYLEYDPSQPVPAGYRVQRYYQTGYLLGGALLLGFGYGLCFVASNDSDKDFAVNWLRVPVVGPFIAMTTQHRTCTLGPTPPDCGRDSTTLVVLAALGGMQALGVGLYTYGLTHRRQRLVRLGTPQATVVPIALGDGGYGLAATGFF